MNTQLDLKKELIHKISVLSREDSDKLRIFIAGLESRKDILSIVRSVHVAEDVSNHDELMCKINMLSKEDTERLRIFLAGFESREEYLDSMKCVENTENEQKVTKKSKRMMKK